jgi:hypothetical protein
MIINRNNYEEFFLLYVDNELSAAEKNAVELFVQQNPDLEKELQMLQQTVINDGSIVFDKKESLLKELNVGSFQERLLLYTDDELTGSDKNELEQLIASDKKIAAEWAILQRTKLQYEAIVFEDKGSLYRKERGRVVGFGWWRVAAAVLLLLLGIWLGKTLFTSEKPEVIKNEIAHDKPTAPAINRPVIITPDQSIQPSNSNKENIAATNNEKPSEVVKQPKNNVVTNSKDNIATVLVPNNPAPGIQKTDLENINNNNSNKSIVAAVTAKQADNNIQKPVENIVAVANKPSEAKQDLNNNASANNIAKAAVYRETESENSDTKILYMDEENIKRTKLGGLFRRIKRVVERTTNIKTGNSVKVAGFEIALK